MISTVDPEARHAHKTQSRQQDGFKAHVVIEPDTGLFTATELTKTSGADNSDAAVGARLLPADPTVNPGDDDVQVLGDSAYSSGNDARVAGRDRLDRSPQTQAADRRGRGRVRSG